MSTKVIGVLLLLCSAVLFRYSYSDFVELFFSPSEHLQVKIQKDILNSLQGQLERKSMSIHHVVIKYRSQQGRDFLGNHQPIFETTKDGSVWLEVEVIDLPDQDNPGVITQTSVFDIKTNNKISEFGHTYFFKAFTQHQLSTKENSNKSK